MKVAALVSLLISLPFLFILARRPILRRLALRNAMRRPREALLVVLGSLLGAAIITGSAVVGDTMDSSIRQGARQHLGPIDELVFAQDAPELRSLSGRLRSLPLLRCLLRGLLRCLLRPGAVLRADVRRHFERPADAAAHSKRRDPDCVLRHCKSRNAIDVPAGFPPEFA